MQPAQIKINGQYRTDSDDFGVPSETFRVIRKTVVPCSFGPDLWYVVKFADGGKMCMHPSRMRAV